MTYEDALSCIHRRTAFSSTAGLHRIRALMRELGDPQEKLRCIHIAGTNGKGSTAAFTASALQYAGWKTGLFTSPYLVNFEERFQICGVSITKEELAAVTECVQRAELLLESHGMEAVNEFEMVTAIGFLWFEMQNCDYVVLETGLGGRLDPTNIIKSPVCTCITSVSLDHMARLGSTVEQIAYEKAGIIKTGRPVVTPASQHPDAMSVIQSVCAVKRAPLYIAAPQEIIACDQSGATFIMEEEQVRISLPGSYQIDNAVSAWTICQQIGIPSPDICKGLNCTVWPGRMQLISKNPMVLVDCAHNEDAAAVLAENLKLLFPDLSPVYLMAMMADKAHEKCIHRLTCGASRIYATTLPLPRALSAEELAAEALCAEKYILPDPDTAVSAALEDLQDGEILVICGSVYLAGTVLPLLEERLFCQPGIK